MRFKLICCEVFMREACLAIAETPHVVDPEFTPKGAHENSDHLRELIQNKIDDAEKAGGYDAILLGYGLCGNAAAGLIARSVPLVIPRAHDCCTIFLGSRKKFIEYFSDNLSAEWSSAGYMERGYNDSYLRESDVGKLLGMGKTYEEYVEQYGEENAKYLWETLHPEFSNNELIFIEVPETAHLGYLQKLRDYADQNGKSVRVLDGDMRLIRNLLNCDWSEEEFLVVAPGKHIKPVYDQEKVVDC